MFKKTKLAAAMLAVVATSAQAVHVSPLGTGQVLIYPYYNVNNGFQTQISVVNSTSVYKAVKVRFRESGVSNDVLDFNVYMSPNDVWTATVRKKGDKANLVTTDTTCTLPDIPDSGVDFITAYDATDDADAREGYIEMIEMGVVYDPRPIGPGYVGEGLVDPDEVYQPEDDLELYNPLIVEGLKHTDAGVPKDCGVVAEAWRNEGFTEGGAAVEFEGGTPGSPNAPLATVGTRNWFDQPYAMRTPDGGLFGNTILLNTETGSAYVIDPVAISDYAADPFEDDGGDFGEDSLGRSNAVGGSADGSQHYLSDDPTDYLLPSLGSGNVLRSNKVQEDGRNIMEVLWETTDHDYGKLDKNVAPNEEVASGLNPFPLAHALQIRSFAGEYFIEEYFDGATDWVITMPMKKHGIFSNDFVYEEGFDGDDDLCEDGIENNETCLLPLTSQMSGGADDVQVAVVKYDREERQVIGEAPPPGFSPPLQPPSEFFSLTREVNIVGFSLDGSVPENNVLGSDSAKGVKVDFEKGWAWVVFDGRYDLIDAGLYSNGDPQRYYFYHGGLPEYYIYGPTQASDGTVTNFTGVPAIGAAATRGDVDNQGSATVGETFPLKIIDIDDNPNGIN